MKIYEIKFGYKKDDNLMHATHSHMTEDVPSIDELKRITTIISGVKDFVYFEVKEQ